MLSVTSPFICIRSTNCIRRDKENEKHPLLPFLTAVCLLALVLTGCGTTTPQSYLSFSKTDSHSRIDRVIGIKLTPNDNGYWYCLTLMIQDNPEQSAVYKLYTIQAIVNKIEVTTDLAAATPSFVILPPGCATVDGRCTTSKKVVLNVHSLNEIH